VLDTQREFETLFRALDRLDHNGDENSFERIETRPDAPGPVVTAPGRAFAVLHAHAQRVRDARPFERDRFIAELGDDFGTLDVDSLLASETDRNTLAAAGLNETTLRELAGPDGLIRSQGVGRRAVIQPLEEMGALYDAMAASAPEGFSGVDLSETPPSAQARAFTILRDHMRANRQLPRYQQPGGTVDSQSRLTVAANAMTVAEGSRLSTVHVDVNHINQFSLYPDDPDRGSRACGQAAHLQTVKTLASIPSAQRPRLRGPEHAIQVGHSEDGNGRLAVDATRAEHARRYIDQALDAGWPVLVGASYDDNAYNNDRLTDHFVTINGRGYGEAGRLYYTFVDPGTSDRPYRFYVDRDSGRLFKEGDQQSGYVSSADYEVTQVRVFDREPPAPSE
ncbi:MAG: hypothetical protein AAF219_11500, partial [Myxococcota bacterium]